MFTFFVPFNICLNLKSEGGVPHTLIQKSEYHSIVYNYYEYNTSTFKNSAIDYKRLTVQILILTIVCGIPYYLLKSFNTKEYLTHN